eukprot:gene5152-5234_t
MRPAPVLLGLLANTPLWVGAQNQPLANCKTLASGVLLEWTFQDPFLDLRATYPAADASNWVALGLDPVGGVGKKGFDALIG